MGSKEREDAGFRARRRVWAARFSRSRLEPGVYQRDPITTGLEALGIEPGEGQVAEAPQRHGTGPHGLIRAGRVPECGGARRPLSESHSAAT